MRNLYSPSEGRNQECVGGANPNLTGVRVLVVDDDSDARRLTRRLLIQCNAEVVIAASAAEGLEFVPRFGPHVLVSDIGMPEMDGYQYIRMVRKTYPARVMPAVAVTAFVRAEDRKQALAAGYQEHLAKPVAPDRLLAVIASLAAERQSNACPPVAHDYEL
jgi:CheY-like chemotaxis protein